MLKNFVDFLFLSRIFIDWSFLSLSFDANHWKKLWQLSLQKGNHYRCWKTPKELAEKPWTHVSKGVFTWHRGDFRIGASSLWFPLMALYLVTWYHHKCHAGASHPGVSSPPFLYQGENFIPLRNLATVSCKLETTTRFGVKSVCQ